MDPKESNNKQESKRLSRVSETYQKELTNLLHFDMRDPRLTGVTITRVVFTPDLRLAKVYFLIAGGRTREPEVIEGFERSKGHLRHELAERVKLRYTPELRFYFDESEEVKAHMDDLFRKIEETRHGQSEED